VSHLGYPDGSASLSESEPRASERAALIDLLAALAYGELSAFDRISRDARLAPDLAGRAAVAQAACVELTHHRLLVTRLATMGVDPEGAMAPFVAALDRFHDRTEPSTWLESLVKAHIGDGLAADFYREMAELIEPASRSLILEVLADSASSAFAAREVRAAVTANPALTGRLSLWGRRLVGEAISQTQHVLAERDSVMMLLMAGPGGLSGVSDLMSRITSRHRDRMAELGLAG